MFDSGAAVAAALEAGKATLDDAQRQPNGVDLTVEAVFEQASPGAIRRDGKRGESHNSAGRGRQRLASSVGSNRYVRLGSRGGGGTRGR